MSDPYGIDLFGKSIFLVGFDGNEKYETQLQAEIPYRVSVGCPEEVCSFDRLTRYVEDLGETKALLDAIREGAPETPMLFVMTYAENKTSGLHSQDIMVRLFGRHEGPSQTYQSSFLKNKRTEIVRYCRMKCSWGQKEVTSPSSSCIPGCQRAWMQRPRRTLLHERGTLQTANITPSATRQSATSLPS